MQALDEINTVVVLDIDGLPDVVEEPKIKADAKIFINEMAVLLSAYRRGLNIRYTLDNSPPSIKSPL